MGYLKNIIKKYSVFHKNSEVDILIFSAPRSGSTWLFELIAGNSKGKNISEPFDLRNSQVSKNLNTTDWKYLIDQSNKKTISSYLRNLSKGHLSFKNPPPFSKYYKSIVNFSVIKMLHGGETMVKELKEALNAKTAYLVRHPIPVSLSRKELPRLKSFIEFEPFKLTSKQKEFALNIFNSGSHFEKAVLDWCFQNKLALDSHDLYDIKITYEDLVLNPLPIIKEMESKALINNVEAVYSKLSTPSVNSYKSNNERKEILERKDNNQEKLVTSWLDKVDDNKIRKTQEILDAFEIEAYKANSPYPVILSK